MPRSPPVDHTAKGGGGGGHVERITDALERPSLDDRTYRVVRLVNQLEALLVHDAETDKASAALDVNVGSFYDEEDMAGMAHAVEHVCCSLRAPPAFFPVPTVCFSADGPIYRI